MDRWIRSVSQSDGRMSGKLLEQYPVFGDQRLRKEMIRAIMGEGDSLEG